MTQSHPATSSLLETLNLTHDQAIALPPELRDQVLDFLALWGDPNELLELLTQIWQINGPSLPILDRQAGALFSLGDYERALEVLERRQRRSTTIASQALEARLLLASGRREHALDVANDIGRAYPLNVDAVSASAEVYAGLGKFDQARSLLETYLQRRPGNLTATITLARLALAQGEQTLATEYVQQLGAGIPSGIEIADLRKLEQLHVALGNQESADAARIELERRRQLMHRELMTALAPFVELAQQGGDWDEIYHALNGPESVPISAKERRKIQLEAIRHFGFTDLRPGQAEIMNCVLHDDSVLAVMPTGAGKSLCYQLPAMLKPKATLVISPLIALMKDQVEGLPMAARAKAAFINSTLSDEEVEARLSGLAKGEYKLVYAAPERLRQRPFLRALRDAGLSLFVVDEAHCVSLWGHDFRPDYLFIQEARAELGNPPALAMTATAPPRVRDEILEHLSQVNGGCEPDAAHSSGGSGWRRPRVIALDIYRSNLHLSALEFQNDEQKQAALLKFVKETDGSGIIYTNSRRKCEALALQLRNEGVQAEAYHAGMPDRSDIQDRFMNDQTRVVVATIAFGMGIDKADIRFIVHFHPPRSLASYYQEAGRAGRDGKPAQCVLFYSRNDWANLRRWAKADEFSLEFLRRVYLAIAAQLGVSKEDEEGSRLSVHQDTVVGPVNTRRLEQVLNASDTEIRVAVSLLERAGLLDRSFDFPRQVEVGIARQFAKKDALPDDDEFQRFLRKVPVKPGRQATFRTDAIARGMGWPVEQTEQRLLAWQSHGWIKIRSSKREMLISLPPEPPDLSDRLDRLLNQSRVIAQRRIDEVVGYATTDHCRHGYISSHFGSPPRTRCTVCDNCTGIRPDVPQQEISLALLPDADDIEPMILDCLVSLPKPVGRSGLARVLTGSLRAPVMADQCRHHGRLAGMGEAEIMEYIDDLIEKNYLRQYVRMGYPVLSATMHGRAAAEVWLSENPELAQPTASAQNGSPEDEADEAVVDTSDQYTALQKALWHWRRRTAEEQDQPPYVIMSNDLMYEIARVRPRTLDELAAIPGIGVQRLKRYGQVILDLIKVTPAEAGDEEKLDAQAAEAAQPSRQGGRDRRAAIAGRVVSAQCERQIFLKLQELRQKKAVQERNRSSAVAPTSLLKTIAKVAPRNEKELMQIVGFRSSGLRDEADTILAIVAEASATE